MVCHPGQVQGQLWMLALERDQGGLMDGLTWLKYQKVRQQKSLAWMVCHPGQVQGPHWMLALEPDQGGQADGLMWLKYKEAKLPR